MVSFFCSGVDFCVFLWVEEISMKQSEELNMSDNVRALLGRARLYCAASEQCCGDVRRKLSDWGATTDEAEDIVGLLCEEGYVDDRRYARAYCESKMLRGGWGCQKVAYHLRMKGVDSETVAEALADVDDEACNEVLAEIAERKASELRSARTPLEPDVLRRKLTAFLMQRGFRLSEINPVLQNILKR